MSKFSDEWIKQWIKVSPPFAQGGSPQRGDAARRFDAKGTAERWKSPLRVRVVCNQASVKLSPLSSVAGTATGESCTLYDSRRFVIEYPAMSNDEPLELRDFVAETIKHIIDGVAAAQQYAATKRAIVNPRPSRLSQRVESISFDVGVTAAKGTKTQGGVAVFTGAFGLGSKAQSEKANERVNRIQFSVHVSLPIGDYVQTG